MAQSALKTCEMCISAPGSHYCLDCCQYFCDNCKSMHTRVKLTKNHKFESASNVIPEVKSQCIEHNEGFVFVCTSCDVPVCIKCIAGKHNGHKVGHIADIVSCFKKEFTNDIKTKFDAATKTVAETEIGLKTFDNNIKSAINDIKEEGRKLKAMIDRQVAQMIKTLREKAALEKDKLLNIVSDTKNVLDRCREFEIQNDQLQTAREDADLIKKLKGLKIESEKIKVGAVPKLPGVNISKATVTDKKIIKLFGTYSISETKLMTTGIVKDNVTSKDSDSEEERYLFICEECGTERISSVADDYLFYCDTCEDDRYLTYHGRV